MDRKRMPLIIAAFLLAAALLLIAGHQGRKEGQADPIGISPLRCTYVQDLTTNGVSETEALQNMDCCNDSRCPFHHPYCANNQ